MENSQDYTEETALALQTVRDLTDDENVLACVEVFLSSIPYAGGPLSTILSEYRTRRNSERIFDALVRLGKAVDKLSGEKRHILSKDEVIEIVHATLEDIATTSNEEKLQYLSNSLTNAFTNSEIPYPEKHQYISVLKGLTPGELALIREIYMSSDPFVQIYSKRKQQTGVGITSHIEQPNVFIAPPQYDIVYKEPDDGETLREVLQKKLSNLSEGMVEGLSNALDAKGLSAIGPNLNNRTVKIMTERQYEPSSVVFATPNTHGVTSLGFANKPQKTPIEASRTQFGENFIRYIQSEY